MDDSRLVLCIYFMTVMVGLSDTRCSYPWWNCRSGMCIKSEYKCDGISNCNDSSDEAIETCGIRSTRRAATTSAPCHCKYKFSCNVLGVRLCTECEEGWEGVHCDKRKTGPCRCRYKWDCSFTSGMCTSCIDGWTGYKCDQKVTYIHNTSARKTRSKDSSLETAWIGIGAASIAILFCTILACSKARNKKTKKNRTSNRTPNGTSNGTPNRTPDGRAYMNIVSYPITSSSAYSEMVSSNQHVLSCATVEPSAPEPNLYSQYLLRPTSNNEMEISTVDSSMSNGPDTRSTEQDQCAPPPSYESLVHSLNL